MATIMQYLGTEVFYIKKIAELGPSRFTAYTSIIWTIECSIILSYVFTKGFTKGKLSLLFNKRSTKYSKEPIWITGKIEDIINAGISILNKFTRIKYLHFASIIIFVASTILIWQLTIKHPLDIYHKGQARAIVNYITKHTDKGSSFFAIGFDSFILRVYAKRAVFVDTVFPFHEDFMNEFTERLFILQNSIHFKPSDYKCLQQYYPVDYLIIPKSKATAFKEEKPFFSFGDWFLYKVNKFATKSPCTKEGLLGNSFHEQFQYIRKKPLQQTDR